MTQWGKYIFIYFSRNKFRTLITRIRPVEVLCEPKFLRSDMSKMLRSSPIVPVFSSIQTESKIDYRSSKELINFYFNSDSGNAPLLINKILNDFDNYSLAVTALGNSISNIFQNYVVFFIEAF